MAAAQLTPPILATHTLPSGQSLLIQQKVDGQTPSRQDFQTHLKTFAAVLHQTHQNEDLKKLLLPNEPHSHKYLAQTAFNHVAGKWRDYRPQLHDLADKVDRELARLREEIKTIEGEGVVASHNDSCNDNWLITGANEVFLIDLDSMTLDDPAVDLGALLWWYYPPEMRGRFLVQMGYQYDDQLKKRMRIRMSIHCLNILLPRENSFDQFDPNGFASQIVDFFAVANGNKNPQGYA
ncbi:MAG: phosphotransferase family protein [Anaerolineae bacterium]